MRRLILVAVAAASLAFGAEARSTRVSLAGLDLTAPAGQAVALERIQKAVKRVCADAGLYGISSKNNKKACEQATMGQAVAQLEGAGRWLADGAPRRLTVAAATFGAAPLGATLAPRAAAPRLR